MLKKVIFKSEHESHHSTDMQAPEIDWDSYISLDSLIINFGYSSLTFKI